MPLSVSCKSCGHLYTVSSKLAGKTLRCKQCSGPVEIPAAPVAVSAAVARPGAAAPTQGSPIPDPVQHSHPTLQPPVQRQPPMPPPMPSRGVPTTAISTERRLAARILFVLCGICFLGTICTTGTSALIFLGVVASETSARNATQLGTFLMLVGLLAGGLAITYLICGLRIRLGNVPAVIVALIAGSIHALGSLYGAVTSLFKLDMMEPMSIIGPVLQLLLVAALGQLIFYLVKILRLPRA